MWVIQLHSSTQWIYLISMQKRLWIRHPYSLETSENQRVFLCFQGVSKDASGIKYIKHNKYVYFKCSISCHYSNYFKKNSFKKYQKLFSRSLEYLGIYGKMAIAKMSTHDLLFPFIYQFQMRMIFNV